MCMLNLSHCMLKLGRACEAAAEAGAVIAIDKRSLKGYYRRYVFARTGLRCPPFCVLTRASRPSLPVTAALRGSLLGSLPTRWRTYRALLRCRPLLPAWRPLWQMRAPLPSPLAWTFRLQPPTPPLPSLPSLMRSRTTMSLRR